MDLITYLEENSNIDSEFIEDIFGNIEYNDNINLDIVLKWNNIENKEEYKKEFIEKEKYILENEKILIDLTLVKKLMNEENRLKIYTLENLVNKYQKYKIKKLKKRLRILNKSLKDNNKVVLNTINSIQNESEKKNIPIYDINNLECNICPLQSKYDFTNIFNNMIFYILLGLMIIRIIIILFSLFSSYNHIGNNIFLSIFNKITIFILIAIIIVKIFLLLSSSILIASIKK
jgi:hypothetical protein